jgi:hypothetical protein
MQWKQLKTMFVSQVYMTEQYGDIISVIEPVLLAYDKKKPFTANWLSAYDKLKKLQEKYDTEKNEEYVDIDFCLYFISTILTTMKHQRHLFAEDIDNSEWDYIVKFWGPVIERLYMHTGLRLKWYII